METCEIKERLEFVKPRMTVIEMESQSIIADSEPPQIQNFETDVNGKPFDITGDFILQN